MEQMLSVAYTNLLSPVILFFVMGIVAVLVNSDLKVPSAFYAGYTMIILFTIGIKGGVELKQATLAGMLPAVGAALALSVFMLFVCFLMLRRLYKFAVPDAAAVAAHYGSVSAVTFIACLSFLDKIGVVYESYVTALLVLMEGPAIIGAIILYKLSLDKVNGSGKSGGSAVHKEGEGVAGGTDASGHGLGQVVKEAFFGKSIFLLLGGILIGLIAHEDGLVLIRPLFGDLFYGLLCIFLLHLGMISTQKLRQIRPLRLSVFSFAFLFPVIGGVAGTLAGWAVGLSPGGMTILATLGASASYIAAPAAVEQAIPEANSGLYLGSALGLTLPFNLVAGIPAFYGLSVWLSGL